MNIYVFQPVLYLIAVTKYCVAFFLHFSTLDACSGVQCTLILKIFIKTLQNYQV